MEQKIVFATGNEGKMREVRLILQDLGFPVLSMKEAGVSLDIEENGTTFAENAMIKARAVWEKTGGIVLADDSEKIYQSDLCGWVGQMGYGREDAYGANVYQTEVQETLHGAGFYATGEHTSYEIYVARDLEHNKGFQKRQLMAKGEVR